MEEIYWLWLSLLPHIGPVFQKRLLKHYGTPENVYVASEDDLRKNINGLSTRALQSLTQSHSLDKAKYMKEKCDKQKVKILTIDSQNYVEIAKGCPESPIVLYYKGVVRPIRDSIAIVGSRRCTDYGKKVTQQIAAEFSKQNIAIVSGMAKGIDSYAHTTVLKNNGYTLAFLANGVDLCYPPEHRALYEEIIRNGAILSEYPPGTNAHPKYFLKRNALISAWSDKVIVVEAGEKSGALTTVDFAQKYSREIFAVPNRIDEPNGRGTNVLLQSIAKPYLGIMSLNLKDQTERKLVPPTKKSFKPKLHKADSLNPIEKRLLKIVGEKPKQISEIQNCLKISTNDLEELLFNLELKGKIKVHGENIFSE
ncbi:MAG TPA: DNA-protecting protein DprA [Bacillales bacterium]|nr:DNA-protecting protein DprA [Bacillales bacterium]